MFDRRKVIALLLAGALATGCSEGTTEPPNTGEPLSVEESVALFKAFEVFQNDSVEIEPVPLGGVDITEDCPGGGQVSVTGTAGLPTTGDPFGIVADLNVVPNACRLSRSGLDFTIDGAPSVRNRFSVTVVDFFDVRIEGTVAGTLDWQLADRSGRCAIDMALSGGSDPSAPEPMVTATWSGTLCGHTVEIPAAEGGFQQTG